MTVEVFRAQSAREREGLFHYQCDRPASSSTPGRTLAYNPRAKWCE